MLRDYSVPEKMVSARRAQRTHCARQHSRHGDGSVLQLRPERYPQAVRTKSAFEQLRSAREGRTYRSARAPPCRAHKAGHSEQPCDFSQRVSACDFRKLLARSATRSTTCVAFIRPKPVRATLSPAPGRPETSQLARPIARRSSPRSRPSPNRRL